jgi:cardiolipin synthase
LKGLILESRISITEVNLMSDPFLSNALSEQLISRATGSELVPGNRIKILIDGRENYPAWIEAICSAKETIFFESYIIYEDEIGNQFADLLVSKAKEGVRVRVIYDWLGGIGRSSKWYWQRLRNAGVEVRCFNPPRFDSPLSWFSRDHRKMITIDGAIGFVSGLCVGQKWIGNPQRSIEPWRDTGVEIRGPAVANLEEAFAEVWETAGPPLPKANLRERGSIPSEGSVSLRVVAGLPTRAGLYRFDHLIAGLAREYLWLTDAYFVGVTPYVQALRAAVEEGVDVRLLVPGTTDIPLLQALSRVGYKPLLEAGIRIFEWNGLMLHAKTAVADRRWARVGSTNLNFSSWIGNYELDVAIEDEEFSKRMEGIYLEDLSHSTEILLGEKYRLSPVKKREKRWQGQKGPKSGSVSPVGAGAIRLGNVVGSVVKNQRILGPAGAKIMLGIGIFLLVIGTILVLWPKWVTIPMALVFGWMGGSLLINAFRLQRKKNRLG